MKVLITSAVLVVMLVLADKAHRYWIMYGPHNRKKD